MNEQDFRNELRRTMATLPARPEMNDATVLDAARRDLRRRRTMWAGVGSATAVVAVAVGVAVLARPGADGGGGVQVGNQPSSTQSASTTADEPSARLAVELAAVVPAGYDSPDDLTGADGRPLEKHYVNYDGSTGEDVDGWAYTAAVPLKKGEGIGELSVTVFGPNEHRTGRAGCELNPGAWNPQSCSETTVGGKTVGVFTTTADGHAVQHAVFQYDDGTLVELTQGAGYRWAGVPALPDLPLSTEQLTALVTDPRFKLR